MVNIEIKDNYAIVQLDNGKVNAIGTELCRAVSETFESLENDGRIKGAILTGRPNCFSAGLDVMELASHSEEEAATFWEAYISVLQSLVNFSKPLVCAITGYAPAGATIWTLCTDYRIMAIGTKHVIGMHEFKMSMQIPEILCNIYAYVLGENIAWKAVQKASLFNSDQALEIGLVDESIEVEEVLPRAEEYLRKLLRVIPSVYAKSKLYFRKQLSEIVNIDVEQKVKEIIVFNRDPELRQTISDFAESLKKK